MDIHDYVHIFDGFAGAAAMFLGWQVKQAVTAIKAIVDQHDHRISALEQPGKRKSKKK